MKDYRGPFMKALRDRNQAAMVEALYYGSDLTRKKAARIVQEVLKDARRD